MRCRSQLECRRELPLAAAGAVAELCFVRPVRTQREKLSDAQMFTVAALLIMERIALAIAFAYLLTLFIFHTSLQLPRLTICILASLGTLLIAGALSRNYRSVPGVVLYSLRAAAVVFLGIAWRCWTLHIHPHSLPMETAAIVVCCFVVGWAIIDGFR